MASKRNVRRRQMRAREAPTPELRVYIRNSCSGKRPFPTHSQAKREMQDLMDAPYYDGEPLEVYPCPITGDHFHFGHPPEKAHRSKHAFYCTQC